MCKCSREAKKTGRIFLKHERTKKKTHTHFYTFKQIEHAHCGTV